MLFKELSYKCFLFLCQSFIVTIFNSADSPIRDVVCAKVFEMPLLASDT